MYIITREGVYRHEIVGCFTSLKRAEKAAEEALEAEPDDHHYFGIYWFKDNAVLKNGCDAHSKYGNEGGWNEKWVKSIRRSLPLGGSVYEVRWDKATKLQPIEVDDPTRLAYELIEGDPIALDMMKDMLKL